MGDLEQGRHAEDLCEVGANASEHGVVEEDIARNLPGQALYGARVGQAQLGAALGKGVDCIAYCVGERVGEEEGG